MIVIPGDRGWGAGSPGHHTHCQGRWLGAESGCCSCTSGARSRKRRRSWRSWCYSHSDLAASDIAPLRMNEMMNNRWWSIIFTEIRNKGRLIKHLPVTNRNKCNIYPSRRGRPGSKSPRSLDSNTTGHNVDHHHHHHHLESSRLGRCLGRRKSPLFHF